MPELSVNRTLVKSPPELWSEFSEVECLANHLEEFGQITISRLEPEHTVAWDGEHTYGTVQLEASGWGTKVTMTAEVSVPPVVPDLEAWDRSAAEIESHAGWQTAAARRAAERAAERSKRETKGGLARRLLRSQRAEPEAAPARPSRLEPSPSELDPAAEQAADGGAPAVNEERARAVLEAALDNVGSADNRPFSRG